MYVLSKAMNNIFNIIPEKDFQDAFAGISEILITYATNKGKARAGMLHIRAGYNNNWGKARVMLHIGAGHNNNHQIISILSLLF